ncbi:hypothetical protein L7F22_008038 [Adiantum nelumboides]|nr:hypothetical protein [Adiantum nelumboides]
MASLTLWVVILLASWKLGCLYLRKRRSQLLARLKDCHALNACTLFVEFPFLYRLAFEYGLMKTAGIPAITRRVKTGGEAVHNPAKRYDDTDILIRELLLHHVDTPRGSLAVRRLNFLHSHYNIHNQDYIYVLAIHILTVIEWASMFGYREWTELEKSTHYKVWHDIGTRMGMRDIPATLADLAQYKEDYEAKYMVFAKENHEFAEIGMKLLLDDVPKLLWPFGRRVLISVMDDRLVASLGYSKQPHWLTFMSHALLKLHGVVVSWMPPRPLSWAQTRIAVSMFSGCPILQQADGQLPLAYQRFPPIPYPQGYRIAEIGGKKAGMLSSPFKGGSLQCPLRSTPNISDM